MIMMWWPWSHYPGNALSAEKLGPNIAPWLWSKMSEGHQQRIDPPSDRHFVYLCIFWRKSCHEVEWMSVPCHDNIMTVFGKYLIYLYCRDHSSREAWGGHGQRVEMRAWTGAEGRGWLISSSNECGHWHGRNLRLTQRLLSKFAQISQVGLHPDLLERDIVTVT